MLSDRVAGLLVLLHAQYRLARTRAAQQNSGAGRNPVTRAHLEARPWSAVLVEDAVGLTG